MLLTSLGLHVSENVHAATPQSRREGIMAPLDFTSGFTPAPADKASSEPEITSAQLLRRHAQDLIETAERLLAQAEAELETAYAMVSAAAGRSAAVVSR
jgi:hypothetical protein